MCYVELNLGNAINRSMVLQLVLMLNFILICWYNTSVEFPINLNVCYTERLVIDFKLINYEKGRNHFN